MRWVRLSLLSLLTCATLSCATSFDVTPRADRSIAPKPASAIAPTPPPPPAVVDEPLTIPLVTLDGSPAEMGATHGRALAEQVQFLQKSYLEKYLERAGTTRKVIALAATS